ncbi:MAG: transcriptional regulator NrdR [Eubacteriales bacterium]|nr:transcriptional regulator NrdR [Eubacteriales bacterium]
MKCPYCGNLDDKVIDSRPADEGAAIRRRRECINCSGRFTTYEKVESTPIVVVKKDMTRQVFDRNRILNGLLKACEKRPVPVESLEKLIDEIEIQIKNQFQREVTTRQIGEMVMERLKNIDDVAYVRFASVYRQFKDIGSFMDILKKLQDENVPEPDVNVSAAEKD